MSRLAWTAAALFVISIPLFLVSNSVIWAVNSPGVYARGFEKYNVSLTTGITDSDLRQVGADLRRYFNTRNGPLSVRTRVQGVERDIFSPREVQHMRDVRRLVRLVYAVATLTGVYLLLATGLGIVLRHGFPRGIARLCLWGGTLTLALVLAIGLFALVGFDTLFLKFHQFSFTNDLWQLDPRTDYLVIMFPQDFWFDATIRVAAMAVTGAAVLITPFGGYLLYQNWTAGKETVEASTGLGEVSSTN